MFKWIAIKYLSWNLRRQGVDNIEYVIRSDGHTMHKRNKERENSMKETLSKIK